MRCALYGRVSTSDRATKTDSEGHKKTRQDPEVQLRQLREFAAEQGWEIVAEYIDRESGAKEDRTEFARMMEDAKCKSRRRFDVVLFWSIDRFSRAGIIHVLSSLKRLSDCEIKYRSFQEPYIDTTHEFGDLLAAFAAKLAELERKRIRARIKAGLAKARANGVVLGPKRLVFDRSKVWQLKDQGLSVRKIAAELKLSHGTVQRTLQGDRVA